MPQIFFNNHVNEKLAGTLDEPPHPSAKGMVLGHCFTCSRHTRVLSDVSRAMIDLGYTSLRFDFSGNGQSQGEFKESTYSKQIRELQCGVDYLNTKGVKDVVLAGHSMGGAAALLAAGQMEEIRGVVAIAVGATLLDPGRALNAKEQAALHEQGQVLFSSRGRDLVLTREFFEDAGRYDLVQSISKINCPVLLIYAGKDTIIAPDSGRILHEANPSGAELFRVDTADHMFTRDQDRRIVAEQVAKWAQRL